jgi:hypothetical protein
MAIDWIIAALIVSIQKSYYCFARYLPKTEDENAYQAYDQFYPILIEFNLRHIIFLGEASLLQSEFA